MSLPENADEFLRELAKRNAYEGVFYEPRIYYNRFDFDRIADIDVESNLRTVRADPSVFYNGEQTPVRVKYITAVVDPTTDSNFGGTPALGDERMIQRYGMRVRSHDTFYMNRRFVPFPLWHNQRTAAPQIVTLGNSVFQFLHPVQMGQRDSFIVDAQLNSAPANGRIVGAAFSGKGALSERPYRRNSTLELTDTTSTRFDPSDLKNDGGEVIDIDQMVLHCGSDTQANNPAGDIREMFVQVRQTGNGTNIDWLKGGPVGSGGSVPLCPAAAIAPHAGRCVVHQLPGDGWLWQPGQGLEVEVFNFDSARQQLVDFAERVWVAMIGERIIT